MMDFLSTAEIGERLGVSARRVQSLVKAGRVPAVRHGRNIRIPRAAWENFLADQTREALESLSQENKPHA